MLDQQQHLQQAHAQLLYIGAESLFGLVDAEVRRRLDAIGDAVIQFVKRYQGSDRLMLTGPQRTADGGEHGPFAHGGMTSGEHVVAAHLPQHVLEQFEFIVHERIRCDEIVLAVCLVITEFRSLTSEFEHGAQVRVLLIPQLVHHRLIFRFLGQQALLNDLHHVGAVELQLDGEPALDLRKIIALLLGPIANNGIHVFLGSDHHPCTPVGLDGKILGDGLQ